MTLGVAAPGLDQVPRQKATVSEGELVRGYSGAAARPPAVRACSCGTGIRASSESDGDVVRAIRIHNDTDEHAAWRVREGIA